MFTMKRNLWFWLYFIAAILLAIYFATRIVMAFIGYGPTAMIRNVSVFADTNDKDLTTIVAAAGIPSGTHTYPIKLELVNARIANTHLARESAVRRLANGNLAIKVNFYTAVAEITNGVYYYPLSDKGECIETPSEKRGQGSVVFHGECVTECKEKCKEKTSKKCESETIVFHDNDKSKIFEKCEPDTIVLRGQVSDEIGEITKAAHNLISDLDYLEWIDDRRWNMVTNGGITIKLPEKDPIAAIGNIIVLNKKYNILSKAIKVIDMRDAARILVK